MLLPMAFLMGRFSSPSSPAPPAFPGPGAQHAHLALDPGRLAARGVCHCPHCPQIIRGPAGLVRVPPRAQASSSPPSRAVVSRSPGHWVNTARARALGVFGDTCSDFYSIYSWVLVGACWNSLLNKSLFFIARARSLLRMCKIEKVKKTSQT